MDRRSVSQAMAEAGVAAIPVGAIVIAVATIAGAGVQRDEVTRLAQLSPALLVIDLLAGLTITASGSIAWVIGRRSVGLAAILAAAGWFGSDWAGYPGAPGVLRAMGIVASAVTLPMLAWSVAATWPRAATSRVRMVLAGATALLVAVALIWVVAWVPELDPRCLAICDANPLGAGVDFRLARTLANAWQILTVVLAIGVGAGAALAFIRETTAGRRRRWPTLGATAVVGIAWAVWGVTLLLPSTVVAPAGAVAVIAFVGRGLALIALAAALLWWTVRSLQTLVAVRGLANRLAPFPGAGSLAAGLADAYRDPRLRLAYPLPGGGFVDAGGHTVEPGSPGLTGQSTEIRRGGTLVAIALHSSASAGEPIGSNVGAVVSLAADNERLFASVRHEVIDLRASRSRIVETGDTARRRLERDLHDGAQQRMLGIVHDLAVARDEAARAGDPRTHDIADAVEAADHTIDALRALARGIHPAVLAEAGLAAALESLADDAPIPMIVGRVPETRCDPAVESAAWRMVAAVVSDAARAGASVAHVSIDEFDGRLVTTVEVDAPPEAIDAVSLADVVGAAGGDLVTSHRDDVLRVRADLPCG